MNQKHKKLLRLLAALVLTAWVAANNLPGFARQAGGPSAPGEPTENKLYFPIAKRNTNFYIETLEVTQATQSFTNPVGLVANRPTTVRLYGRTYNLAQIDGTSAELSAYRGTTLLGRLTLSGGAAYPAAVTRETLRASASMTYNFQLPSSWLSAGNLNLVGALTSGDGVITSAGFTKTVSFTTVSQLKVKAVPIRVNDTYGPADTSYLAPELFKMYPVPSVNVQVHSTYSFSGNFNYDSAWDDLLYTMTDLRDFEVGPSSSTVYYGVIPMRNSSGYTWFDGSGTVGYGWVGDRVSIGISDETFMVTQHPGYWIYLYGADTAAHEIGHNFDRLHSPGCGAGYTEPGYPYANGLIGQYGFQYSDQTVIPSSYNDIMNYCSDQWVSDFTYKGFLANQQLYDSAAGLPTGQSLLVRAAPGADGLLALKPSYSFDVQPSRPVETSEYTVQLLDESGQVVQETPVKVLTAAEKELSTQSIHFAVPLPEKQFASLRLLQNGQEISSRSMEGRTADQASAAPTLSQVDDHLVLDWGLIDSPAVVRFKPEGAESWTALAIDITGGQLSVALVDLPSGKIQFQILVADGGQNLTLEYSK